MPAVEKKYRKFREISHFSIKKNLTLAPLSVFNPKDGTGPRGRRLRVRSASDRTDAGAGRHQRHGRGCSLGRPNGINSTIIKTSERVKDVAFTQNRDIAGWKGSRSFSPATLQTSTGQKQVAFLRKQGAGHQVSGLSQLTHRIPRRAVCHEYAL